MRHIDILHLAGIDKEAEDLTPESRKSLLDALKRRDANQRSSRNSTLGMVGVGLGGLAAGAGGMHLYRKMKERKREQKKEASIKLALGVAGVTKTALKKTASFLGFGYKPPKVREDGRTRETVYDIKNPKHMRELVDGMFARGHSKETVDKVMNPVLAQMSHEEQVKFLLKMHAHRPKKRQEKLAFDAGDAKANESVQTIVKLALGEEMAKRLMKAEHRYRGLGVAKTNPGASAVVKALGIGGVADPRAHRERLHEIIVRSYGKERGSSDQNRRQLYGALNSAAAAKHLMMSLNKEQIQKKLTGKDPSLMDRFLGSLGPGEYA
jgi:hypothetical protein